jgi:hypothetical protein
LTKKGVGGLAVKYVFLTRAQKHGSFTTTPRFFLFFICVIRPYPWFKNLTTDFTDGTGWNPGIFYPVLSGLIRGQNHEKGS